MHMGARTPTAWDPKKKGLTVAALSAGPIFAILATQSPNAPQSSARQPPEPTANVPSQSSLYISDVKVTKTPDSTVETNLTLRINITKRPNVNIDHTKANVQVYFYDTLADHDIELTDANVGYEWLSPNHDWSSTDTETLVVNYIHPINNASNAEAGYAHRDYFGYIIRVYYNDQLQEARADPAKLLKLFPARDVLSPNSSVASTLASTPSFNAAEQFDGLWIGKLEGSPWTSVLTIRNGTTATCTMQETRRLPRNSSGWADIPPPNNRSPFTWKWTAESSSVIASASTLLVYWRGWKFDWEPANVPRAVTQKWQRDTKDPGVSWLLILEGNELRGGNWTFRRKR
jgi:hypothetical protein